MSLLSCLERNKLSASYLRQFGIGQEIMNPQQSGKFIYVT